MNSKATQNWNQGSNKDTVANTGIITAGLMVVVFAAVTAVIDNAPAASQTAYQQKVNVKTLMAAAGLKAV